MEQLIEIFSFINLKFHLWIVSLCVFENEEDNWVRVGEKKILKNIIYLYSGEICLQ